ncbi:MAG: hypothetical protein GKR90_17955 [Pseudomonadales bacterium]|nr:hypothetical protein [Pseudomonadales bacterium]
MCLILFGYRIDPNRPLIVAANRDEFHGRAAKPANFWSEDKNVLAGRDEVAGGTWLGCTRSGRFAALTNFSHPDDPEAPRSRGALVQDFLVGESEAEHYAHHLVGSEYAGFNLLLFDGTTLVCTSNRGTTEVLSPGYYGLSNAELGAEWPKCVQGAQNLELWVKQGFEHDNLVAMLRDQSIPADDQLPHRGRPIEMERRVAPCFIIGDEYGTRASTVLEISTDTIHFSEQSYVAGGKAVGRVSYQLDLER